MKGPIIGISGVRGIVGQTLTPQLATRFGCAFGTYLEGGRVVIGRDNRPSGEMIARAITSGLLATGSEVIDLGFAATPSISAMVCELQCRGGVIISASHNPFQYNGIKFLSEIGMLLTAEQGGRLLEIYETSSFAMRDQGGIGSLLDDATSADRHVARVLGIVDAEPIRAKRFKVVLDGVGGAGGPVMFELLEALGAEVVNLFGSPAREFPRPPEPTPENLGALREAVKEQGADIGLALDPDGDRLALVDERGQCLSEEYTLALAAMHVLGERKGPVAANLSTSRMIDDVAAAAGVEVVRTPVGEVNVGSAMLERGCVIGGEGSGGVIDPRICLTRDSLTGAAMILSLLARRGKPLSEVVAEIPNYSILKAKVSASRERTREVLDRVRRQYADQNLNESDGIRIDWPDAWVHVRPSNTEPVMRIIAEAPTVNEAQARIDEIMQLVNEVMGES